MDLGPQRVELILAPQTREGVPLTAQVVASYQIRKAPTTAADGTESEARVESSSKVRRKKGSATADKEEEEARALARALGLPQPKAQPINKDAVLRAVFCSPDRSWNQCTEDAIRIAMAETINRRPIDDVYLLTGEQEQGAARFTALSREALCRANRRT